jgi:glycosyltransferase involved in cell wall biosynthesis
MQKIISGTILKDLKEMKLIYKYNLFQFNRYFINKNFDNDVLVSIIVPTKNDHKDFLKLAKSIRQSSYKKIELINVDYNPSYKMLEIIKSKNYITIRIDKPGVGYATYIGTQYSNGNIIIRTDADTIFPPHIIALTVNKFTEIKKLKVYHVGHFYYDGDLLDNVMAFLYDKYWRKPYNTTGHFIAFKRDLLSKINFDPNLKYHDDYNFGYNVYKLYGNNVFIFDRFNAVFTSARRIKAYGKFRYLFGKQYLPLVRN